MPELIPVDHDPFNDPPTNLIPVDHDPFASLGAQPKESQTVAPQNVQTDIASLPPKVAGTVGDMLGLTDAAKALRGEMTPEEAEKFALYAAAGLVTPEMRAARAAMNAAEKVAPEAAQAVTQGIRAYHGSPYDFDKFDISKIGTGEGAQVYGHGLYFAENPKTAESYRTELSPISFSGLSPAENATVNAPFSPQEWAARSVRDSHSSSGSPNYAENIEHAQQKLDEAKQNAKAQGVNAKQYAGVQWWKDAVATLKDWQGRDVTLDRAGKTYEVNINADPEHFLDWDKPLSEQSPKVQEALKSIDHPVPKAWQTNGTWEHASGQNLYDVIGGGRTNAAMAQGKTLNASEQLREAGIPGIKYLDQGSRISDAAQLQTSIANVKKQIADVQAHVELNRNNPSLLPAFFRRHADDVKELESTLARYQSRLAELPKPTSNYVLFNDKLVDIIKKYGLAGLVAGGAAHYQTTPVDHNPFE